jgi:tetratricopeptide (TPR) repeat protein
MRACGTRWPMKVATALWLCGGALLALAPAIIPVADRASAEPQTYEAALKDYQADHFSDAERILSALLAKSPDNIQARLLLGWALWNQGRYDEALLAFKAVLHDAPPERAPTWDERAAFTLPRDIGVIDNPDLAEARQGLGWTYFKKGWFRSALMQFELLKARFPKWGDPDLGRGYALLALGQPDRSQADFVAYASRTANTRLAERAWGDLLIAQGQPEKAIAHYERALALKPGWADVQSDLAWAYAAVGRDADAERLFTALKPSRPVEWETGMARIALNRGQLDQAEEALDRVAAKLPGYRRALEVGRLLHERRYKAFDAAWALYREGKSKQAAEAFTALLASPAALSPSARVSALNGLGWSRLALKDLDGAEHAFRESLGAKPNGAEATAGLGWVALERRDWTHAEKAFADATAAEPGLAPAKTGVVALRHARFGDYDRAWELYYAGKPAEALQAFERLRAAPGDLPPDKMPLVTAGIAWSRFALGQVDEAERIFNELARISGEGGGEGRAGLGWVAIKRGRLDEARARFADALKTAPREVAAERGIAELRRLEAPELDAAWAEYGRGKFSDAIAGFRKVADTATIKKAYRTEGTRGLAWSLLRSDKASEALPLFDALVATSADADALLGRGRALSGVGRHAAAVEELKRAAALAPSSVEIIVAQGWAVLRGGDPKGAEEIFLRAYALAPASAEVNRSIAWARVQQHHPGDAMAPFRYALAQAPGIVDDADFRALVKSKEYADLRRNLGWGYITWHGFEAARKVFEEMVSQDRQDGDAQFGLGYALYRLGQYANARATLDRAIAAKHRPGARVVWLVFPDAGTFPILTDPWSIRGWAALFANDVPKAREAFQQSLERDPELVSSLAGLGRALQQSGDVAAAHEAFLRASEIYPTYPTVVAGLRETQSASPRR